MSNEVTVEIIARLQHRSASTADLVRLSRAKKAADKHKAVKGILHHLASAGAIAVSAGASARLWTLNTAEHPTLGCVGTDGNDVLLCAGRKCSGCEHGPHNSVLCGTRE